MKLQFDLRIAPRLHPFNYGELLGRAFYNRTPSYAHHDSLSLHSIGWIRGPVDVTRRGFVFSEPATWSLGVGETEPIQEFLASVDDDPTLIDGIQIDGVTHVQPPSGTATYFAESPILVRQDDEHLTYEDEEADRLMTINVRTKLKALGLPQELADRVDVAFADYDAPRTKVVPIGSLKFRANLCPVQVSAPAPELHDMIMSVGVGGLTGMGLGAIIPMSYR